MSDTAHQVGHVVAQLATIEGIELEVDQEDTSITKAGQKFRLIGPCGLGLEDAAYDVPKE